jgi:hypothetical protein
MRESRSFVRSMSTPCIELTETVYIQADTKRYDRLTMTPYCTALMSRSLAKDVLLKT